MNTDKIYAEALANEYVPKDTSKVVALRKLDRKAKRPADIFGYTFGIIGALVTGLGMCLSMQVIGPQSGADMAAGLCAVFTIVKTVIRVIIHFEKMNCTEG